MSERLFQGVHHVAIICADYPRSKRFYADVLRAEIVSETYREARQSYKLNLRFPDGAELELFSFPDAPPRPSYPEACGLRHLALSVSDLDAAIAHVQSFGIAVEPIRVDELTHQRFTFFADPDGLPIELYERNSDDFRRWPPQKVLEHICARPAMFAGSNQFRPIADYLSGYFAGTGSAEFGGFRAWLAAKCYAKDGYPRNLVWDAYIRHLYPEDTDFLQQLPVLYREYLVWLAGGAQINTQ